MPDQVTVELTTTQAVAARAALLKYLKQSKRLQEDAESMKKSTLAQQIQSEREGLEAVTLDKLSKVAAMATNDKPLEVGLEVIEFRAIDAGIPNLIRGARAAKGTVTSVLKTEWAEELEAWAVMIESELAPMFSDQPDLPKETGGSE